MNMASPATLYERLGRVEGIRRIVDDIMHAHLANPVIRTRFENVKELDHASKMAVEFLCAGCGGPHPYTGKDLVVAHKGMNISEQEYMAAMDDILGALQKNGIGQQTQNEIVAVLYSLKAQVIRL